MAKVDGGRLFAKALKREGVEQIFCLSGGHIMSLFYGCRAEGIKVIDFRHECAAAYAADAYARVTGKPGVVVTTAGPGITDTITAMAEARLQGVPVIHIGGASPVVENDTGPLQDMNTLEILSTCTKWARKIYNVDRIPEYVAMAFRHAMDATPGPVYLECAMDLMVLGYAEEEKVYFPEKYRTEALPFGDPALIDKAADMLVAAERPAMVIGDTARFSAQYGESIAELVNYLKIPVMTQTLPRGLFADEETNPLFKLGNGALPVADVIFTLSVNNDYRVGKANPPMFNKDAKVIQVHPDVTKIGYNRAAEIGIVGGAGPVAKQILDAVKSKTAAKEDLTWINQAQERAKAGAKPWVEGFTAEGTPMHPGRCAYEVTKFLNTEGKDWTVVCDGGDAAQWIKAAATARRTGQIVNFGPLGTIGTGAGFTTGAWAANGKPVLYYTGDGSMGFYSMEFDTFVKQGIPVVCVISNDSSWGMIKLSETFIHPEEVAKGHVANELAHMRRYDKLPEMWGGYGELVTKPEDIVPAIKRGFESGKPAIINVEVDKENMSPVTKGFGAPFLKK
ncbi:MAG: thiamine pyrophosphate-binding protein [Syntrophaceticus sp.]|nr:thiamine pyrophosphate-binding protein [Syntrophaceticus sp.]MDD4782827.1 thiamine pyrophosphate-binding protein [Syntrophaceticus sp.]